MYIYIFHGNIYVSWFMGIDQNFLFPCSSHINLDRPSASWPRWSDKSMSRAAKIQSDEVSKVGKLASDAICTYNSLEIPYIYVCIYMHKTTHRYIIPKIPGWFQTCVLLRTWDDDPTWPSYFGCGSNTEQLGRNSQVNIPSMISGNSNCSWLYNDDANSECDMSTWSKMEKIDHPSEATAEEVMIFGVTFSVLIHPQCNLFALASWPWGTRCRTGRSHGVDCALPVFYPSLVPDGNLPNG